VLAASASSRLPVTYSVVRGPCSVSDVTLTLTGPGSCVVDADQAGDDMYAAAPTAPTTITVLPAPDPPVCADQSVSVANASATTISLGCAAAATDTGDPLTFAVATSPADGTLTALDPSTGTVTYTPAGAYSGSDSFTFSAMDAQGIAAVATVSITVAPVPPPGDTGPPPQISGTPKLGDTLSCSTGGWSGSAPLTYGFQWSRDGAPISSATGATYSVVAADTGHSLTCTVDAMNPGGSTSAQSAPVSIPLASNVFTLAKLSATKRGSIKIKLDAPDAGRFTALATIPSTSAKKDARTAKKTKKPIAYGTRTASVTGGRTLTITVKPIKRAASLLRRKRRLRVTVSITFVPTGGVARTRTATILVKVAHS